MGNVVATTPRGRTTQHRILALHVAGWKNKDIAATLGLSPNYVSQVVTDPEYADVVASMREIHFSEALNTASQKLKSFAHEAVLTVVHLMRTSTSDRVRLGAANSILDRTGLVKRVDVGVTDSSPIDQSAAEFIMAALKESEKDVEPVEMIQDSSGVFKVREDPTELSDDELFDLYGGYGGS